MPPKKKGGKGKGKKEAKPGAEVEDPAVTMKKLKVTFVDLCKSYNIPPVQPFVETIDKKYLAEGLLCHRLTLPPESLDSMSARALSEALRSYKHISELYLWKAGVGDDGLYSLSQLVRENINLKLVELMDNRITARGISTLAEVLKDNENLQTLMLDHNDLGDIGARTLGSGLKWNSHLENLSLQYTSIGPEGGKAVGEDIIGYSKIQNLNLQGNDVGVPGLLGIAKALEKNQHMKTLNLRDNSLFYEKGAFKALEEALRHNTTLENLDMLFNFIDTDGGISIVDGIRLNKSIKSIGVTERMEKDVFDEIMSICGSNNKGGKKGKGKGKKKK
eukprot:GFYU01005426.1.p1 GENE.GFYU01005426.1~~GFYU01005426.1.p1  ORF type:complete len:332 (+),score=95.38 GFYU01005426.1:88-1083(+)